MCKNMIRVGLTAMVALVASMLPLSSNAQSVDDWQWRATVYGWFPSISGKTSFPPDGGGPSVDMDADTIIENLKFVFMGSLEAQKGRYGLWTDVIYLDIEGDKSATRDVTIGRQAIPAGVDMNANLQIKSWLWTIAGTYSVIATPEHSMQVLAGARLIDLEEKLNWQFNGNIGALPLAATGSSTADESFWDGVIGVKGRLLFGADRKWFVPYYLDIGTGQSDFTWQGIVGIGYDFHWGAVTAAWRYLDYEFKSDKPLQTLTVNGPAVGVSFRW
jgi:hypothetical protein